MVRIVGKFMDGSETVYLIPKENAEEVFNWLTGLGICVETRKEDPKW